MRAKALILMILSCTLVFGQNTNNNDAAILPGIWTSATTGNAFEIQLTQEGFMYNNKKDPNSIAYFRKNQNNIYQCYSTSGTLFKQAFVGSTVSISQGALLLINNDTKKSYNLIKSGSSSVPQAQVNTEVKAQPAQQNSDIAGTWQSVTSGNLFEIQTTAEGFKYSNKNAPNSFALFKLVGNSKYECYNVSEGVFTKQFVGSTATIDNGSIVLFNNEKQKTSNLLKIDNAIVNKKPNS